MSISFPTPETKNQNRDIKKETTSRPVVGVLLRDTNSFSKPQLAAFVLAFAVAGYFISKSFASAPTIASLEGEQMTLVPGAAAIPDKSASGGQAMLLSDIGTVTGAVYLPVNVSSFNVVAKGAMCQGAPAMNVSMDGTNLIYNSPVSSTSWSNYSASGNFNSGIHTLNISFVNDYSKTTGKFSSQCSRGLYIDTTNFYGSDTTLQPTPTYTPNPHETPPSNNYHPKTFPFSQ
jgi:hypothetical protein